MGAYQLAIVASGVFFLNALLTGVWKYREMAASPEGVAHVYVDISHRTSLLYAFACVLLAMFANISQLPAWLELLAMVMLVSYFALAVIIYMIHGWRKDTDNQMRKPSASLHQAMWSLIAAEIGGFLILFYGVLTALW
jgi:hypothetical protein